MLIITALAPPQSDPNRMSELIYVFIRAIEELVKAIRWRVAWAKNKGILGKNGLLRRCFTMRKYELYNFLFTFRRISAHKWNSFMYIPAGKITKK